MMVFLNRIVNVSFLLTLHENSQKFEFEHYMFAIVHCQCITIVLSFTESYDFANLNIPGGSDIVQHHFTEAVL